MIVQCADCKTRYRLDPERVPPERIRVRCAQCAAVFTVDGTRRPEGRMGARETSSAARGGTGSAARVTRSPAGSGPGRPLAPAAGARPAAGPALGYREIDLGPTPARSRPASGAAPAAPRATVEPAATVETLPDLDFEIERSAGPMLRTPQPAASDSQSVRPSPSARPVGAPTAAPRFVEVDLDKPAARPEPEAPADPAVRREQEKARRLARALVSDILVYNREKRERALADGTLVQALGHEIKKSWELYKEKVTPEVANSTNHFREALNEILANGQPIF